MIKLSHCKNNTSGDSDVSDLLCFLCTSENQVNCISLGVITLILRLGAFLNFNHSFHPLIQIRYFFNIMPAAQVSVPHVATDTSKHNIEKDFKPTKKDRWQIYASKSLRESIYYVPFLSGPSQIEKEWVYVKISTLKTTLQLCNINQSFGNVYQCCQCCH